LDQPGLAGDVKLVAGGVSELHVDYGGDKRTQDRDIERAVAMARDLWESAMARRKVQTIR
jgi:putative component of toxin-antitoxin plasmid stabilization module